LLSIDIGVDPKNVVAIHVPMSYDLFYQERSVRLGINNSMIDAVSSLPGVATAGIASEIPFRLATAPFGTYIIDDSPTSRAQGTIGVQQMVVSPGYFRAMGLRLVRGRFFDETDNRHDGRFVIVSEDIAETLWPGQDPVMKTLLSGSPPTQRYTVIGVAKNIKKSENNARVWQPSVYYALSSVDMPPANRFLVIRTAIDARPMVDAFQRAIWSVDRNQVIKSTYFMEDEAERDLNGPRFRGLLLGCFAGIAFGIAIIGIYGVISHSVSTRMHEMGVRVALGAQRGDIMSHVLAEGIVLIISGILIGIFGALILGGLIRSYLFGVTPTDTITYLVIAVTFCCVGVLACAIPARRACTADPLVVLRSE
jgi:putative ABC transport system permease protein